MVAHKNGAGEGIRTLDFDLGNREIATSENYTPVNSCALECTGERGPSTARNTSTIELKRNAVKRRAIQWRQETVTTR